MTMTEKTEKEIENDELEDFEEEPSKKEGIRHLIECNCILPQYKKRKNPVWHKFPVFSIVDLKDKVLEKIAQCNNCGIVHKVTEIGVSEITKKENIKSIRTISDIKYGLPESFVGLLEQHKCDISTWEEIEFILEEERWGSFVVLSQEDVDLNIHGKMMIIKGPSFTKVESFSRQNYIE